MLAHGPLAQNLAGEQEIETFRLQPGRGFPEHQQVAVDAGIMAPAETVGRGVNQREKLVGDINQ